MARVGPRLAHSRQLTSGTTTLQTQQRPFCGPASTDGLHTHARRKSLAAGDSLCRDLAETRQESHSLDPGREHEQDPFKRLEVVDPSAAGMAVAPRFSRQE